MHNSIVSLLTDVLQVALSAIIALILRDNLELSTTRLWEIVPHVVVSAVVAAAVFGAMRTDRLAWHYASPGDYLYLGAALFVTILLSLAVGFVTYRLEGVARSLPALQFVVALCSMGAVRTLVQMRYASSLHRSGSASASYEPQEAVLLIGHNALAGLFLKAVEEHIPCRTRIVGVLCPEAGRSALYLGAHKVLGPPEEIDTTLRELGLHGIVVDQIVIAGATHDLSWPTQDAIRRIERSTSIRVEVSLRNDRHRHRWRGSRNPAKSGGCAEDGESTKGAAANSIFWMQ